MARSDELKKLLSQLNKLGTDPSDTLGKVTNTQLVGAAGAGAGLAALGGVPTDTGAIQDPLSGGIENLSLKDIIDFPQETLDQMDTENSSFEELMRQGKFKEAASARPTLNKFLGESLVMEDFPSQPSEFAKALSHILINGGGSTRDSSHLVPLEEGDVSIRNQGYGFGGRVGVKNISLAKALLELGLSGYFSKNKTLFPDELQAFGAPESVNRINKRLTGLDAAITTDGNRYGVEFNTPTPKERRVMFRFNTEF